MTTCQHSNSTLQSYIQDCSLAFPSMHQFENVFLSTCQYGSPKVHFICLIDSFKMFKISCDSSGYIQVKSTQRKKKSLNNKGRKCKEIMHLGLISLSSGKKHNVFSDDDIQDSTVILTSILVLIESDSQIQQIAPRKAHLLSYYFAC